MIGQRPKQQHFHYRRYHPARHFPEWDDILSECCQFFMLIPIVIGSSIMLNRKDRWRSGVRVPFVTSTWIAFWGFAEFYFPGVKSILPGFVTKTGGKLTGGGFEHARFSFRDNPAGTVLCAMAVPLAIALFRWHPAKCHKCLPVLPGSTGS